MGYNICTISDNIVIRSRLVKLGELPQDIDIAVYIYIFLIPNGVQPSTLDLRSPLVRKLSGDETSESESSSLLSAHFGSDDSLWAAILVTMPVGRDLGNSFFSHSTSDALPI